MIDDRMSPLRKLWMLSYCEDCAPFWMKQMQDDEYVDEEYIDEEDDPYNVKEITEENSISIKEEEEVVEFDKVFETVRAEIVDFVNYDQMMEKKVIDALRNGKLR